MGFVCLKFNERNCWGVVNAFLLMISNREHLQIA